MKVVTLKDISLVSSTIPEGHYLGAVTTNGEWSAGTYATGNQVYYSAVIPHMVYESLADANTAIPGTDAAKWKLINATDRWRMFDDYLTTQSYDTTTFEVEVDSSDCDCVGLFNLQSTTLVLSQIVDSVVIKTETIDMDASGVDDWDEWFFAEYESREHVVWEFPQYGSSKVKATFTYITGSPAQCGIMAIGKAYDLGGTAYGADFGINDYSYEKEDVVTGEMYLNEGNYSDTGNYKIWLKSHTVDFVKRKLTDNRGKAAIYDFNSATTDYDSLKYYGITKWRIDIPGPYLSRCTFRNRGLI